VLETSTPCLARACDYLLGGGASFAADRALALRLDRMYPGLRAVLFSSRGFAADAIARIARGGVDQYLDLCSGLPTTPAPHETARAFQPTARVAYVDRDPAVVQHGRGLVPPGIAPGPGQPGLGALCAAGVKPPAFAASVAPASSARAAPARPRRTETR